MISRPFLVWLVLVPIVYNTDKISGYTFTGTPYFFDILSLEPAE